MMAKPAAMPRLPDWPERLAAFIEARRHAPFAWGANDCVTFVFDAVHAMTGHDALAPLRGRWATEEQARAVLLQQAGLVQGVSALLGQPLRSRLLAPRGAVVLAQMQQQPPLHESPPPALPLMGLLVTAESWCAPGDAGLEFRPAAEVRLAWPV